MNTFLWGMRKGAGTIIIQAHDHFPSFGSIFSSKEKVENCRYFVILRHFLCYQNNIWDWFMYIKTHFSFFEKERKKTFILYRYRVESQHRLERPLALIHFLYSAVETHCGGSRGADSDWKSLKTEFELSFIVPVGEKSLNPDSSSVDCTRNIL